MGIMPTLTLISRMAPGFDTNYQTVRLFTRSDCRGSQKEHELGFTIEKMTSLKYKKEIKYPWPYSIYMETMKAWTHSSILYSIDKLLYKNCSFMKVTIHQFVKTSNNGFDNYRLQFRNFSIIAKNP